MFRRLHLPVYVVAGAVLLIVSLAAPAAWATPGQSPAAQTVATATAPAPPDSPDEPEPPTSVPPPATPQAAATIQSAATPAAAPCVTNSRLTLAADRRQVWPGATVVFTATLTNAGQQPLQQIVLENQLPVELEPQSVISGNGNWQGRTLTVTSDALAPAARLAVVYSARVVTAPSGKGIVVRAGATTAGCPAKNASVTLGAPPSELPRTGGAIR